MIQGNYENILGKISRASGLTIEEIERMVEAKRAKLSGLISKEGAAQVVAAELGISFANEKLKINELLPGMKKVNVIGKVITLFPVREFNKNGRSGKVANLIIADETSNIKVVLWDMNHIELIEKNQIGIGHVVEISNGSMRDYELHLGSFSDLKPSQEVFEDVKSEIVVQEKNIFDFKMMDKVKTRAFIVQVFDPKFFGVCPECKRKLTSDGENFSCETHGKIVPEKRALINIVIDDGTETIRAVLFHENVSLLLTELENVEELAKQKQQLLGKEMIFSGSVRNNKVFNNPEFVIDKIEEVNIEELIKKLES
jgi:replication factor A1